MNYGRNYKMQAIRMARRISMYDYLYKGMIIFESKNLIDCFDWIDKHGESIKNV